MKKYVRTILVEDASGAQFQMHEYLRRERVFRYLRKRQCFRLDTGEPAEIADANTFRLISTGETMMRCGIGSFEIDSAAATDSPSSSLERER